MPGKYVEAVSWEFVRRKAHWVRYINIVSRLILILENRFRCVKFISN